MSRAIGITAGDPRGIGPEIALEAIRRLLNESPDLDVHLFAPDEVPVPKGAIVHRIPGWDGTEEGAGRSSADAIRRAVQAALAGEIGAVVTGPVHKPTIHAAGIDFPGQTEFLGFLTASPEVGMLMAAERSPSRGPLRVLLATTHIPLRAVPDAVTTELLTRQTLLLERELRRGWGIVTPRIALCALNPHASDRGLFGSEEAEVLLPAVEGLRSLGIGITGPIPADTVFHRTLRGEFDAVVAPYHDVAMAAFKTVTFGGGVNVTLGLPFPRTSPDHGTAFDIAGKGIADATSMEEAIRLALRLSEGAAAPLPPGRDPVPS